MAAAAAPPDVDGPTVFSEADLPDTPLLPPTYHRNCLYVPRLTVCRYAQTRKGSDRKYLIDVALMVRRTLADTGAGPSIVTTGLLNTLPADAVVSRDFTADTGVVVGPSGEPLTRRGVATIVFDLDGMPCRHRFLVVEGKALLLLGNDFLDAWKASINLNEDGQGQAWVPKR